MARRDAPAPPKPLGNSRGAQIGSSSLIDDVSKCPDIAKIARIVNLTCTLRRSGYHVILVSSGRPTLPCMRAGVRAVARACGCACVRAGARADDRRRLAGAQGMGRQRLGRLDEGYISLAHKQAICAVGQARAHA
jgi:glutamate 5-kinase